MVMKPDVIARAIDAVAADDRPRLAKLIPKKSGDKPEVARRQFGKGA
jgi:hypothetical protein